MISYLKRQLLFSSTARGGEITGIQYLRGIAALAVVLDHNAAMAAFPKYFGEKLLDGAFSKGAIGVDIFFMISGFIIAVVSLNKGSAAQSVSVSSFFIRRATRIIPLMWFAIMLYAAMRFASIGEFPFLSYLRAFFLWPVGDVDPNNIWTLRHEAIFYIVFAATFLNKAVLRPVILVWISAPIGLWICGIETPEMTHPWYSELLWNVGNPANLEFGAGLFVGLAWLRRSYTAQFRVPFLFTLCTAYFAMVWACAVAFDLNVGNFKDVVFLTLLFFPILIIAVHAKAEKPSRIGLLLGAASFSIYLFHPHFLSATLTIWSKIAPGTPVALVVVGNGLISVAACLAIHLLIELPLLRTCRDFFHEKSFLLTRRKDGADNLTPSDPAASVAAKD